MEIDRVLASAEALGVALAAVLVGAGYANRAFLRDVAGDEEAFWRAVARLAAVVAAAFVGWTSGMDNWRQLTGVPYRAVQRFPSRRVEFDPPSDGVRMVTVVLLAATVVLVACLVARHVGGYVLQLVQLVGAGVLWAPLFAIRQRLNVNLAFGFEGSWTAPLDVLGYLLYVALAWAFEITLILVSFAVLLAAASLPVTLVLDLIRRRQPRVTAEATAFFGALGERAGSAGRAK
jgi:hypothetical protein